MRHSVLLLGASGMLGSMLLDVLSQNTSIHLTATVRSSRIKTKLQKTYPTVTFVLFDAEKDFVANLFKNRNNFKWVINAIGIIKPFIHDDNPQEIEHAIAVNTRFPYRLSQAIKNKNTRVIQIATDCVYSGKKGQYIESEQHDALDVYGKTKSLGEVISQQFIHMRVSIIGPELGTHNSLLEWFLHQNKNAQLSGFTNHLWNGVTTLQFAKLCQGMIVNNVEISGVQHIVPADQVTKAKLLEIFAMEFNRSDISVAKTKAKDSVDRTLATLHDKINKQLWKCAGYKKTPTIEAMIEELASYLKQRNI